MASSIEQLGFTLSDVRPENGWHCSHFFFGFDRPALAVMDAPDRQKAKEEFCQIFEEQNEFSPKRCQLGIVSGHKADFSLMAMDPDPIKLESLHQRILNSNLGRALETRHSFVSLTEISEYVLTVDQYAERLVSQGEAPGNSAFETKLKRYSERLEKMNTQRLTPVFPDWPVSCFYPMNKWRQVGANWFTLPESVRHELMSEHARSGIKFAGKVSQLITVSVGLDDWEWGVTLWATNPLHLKQIVYDMRFDKASAKYAEFGQFFTSYICGPKQILEVCLGR